MGAAASTPAAPGVLDVLRPGRPLSRLLHGRSDLPEAPDDEFWGGVFLDYVVADYVARERGLGVLGGVEDAVVALVVRAACWRLRGYCAGGDVRGREVLGALLLARAVLAMLRERGGGDEAVCMVLGGLDGAGEILESDRVDIGVSVVWQLVTFALDCVGVCTEDPVGPHVVLAGIELVFLAMEGEFYGKGTLLRTIVEGYPRPGRVVCALLELVADASPFVDLEEVLGRERERDEKGKGVVAGIGGGAVALAASASGLGLQAGMAGFNDVVAAFSARLPLRAFGVKEGGEGTGNGVEDDDKALDSGPVPPWSPTATISAASVHIEVDTAATPPGKQRWFERASQASSTAPKSPTVSAPSMGSGPRVIARNPTLLAEQALALLTVLCAPRASNPYRALLLSLHDMPQHSPEDERAYSYSRLYETLGHWMAHPRAALLAYYLLTGNRRFRTFALARTDPYVLLVPLLASVRARCGVNAAPADAYMPAIIMLVLTSDRGFCAAIDEITAPSTWLDLIEDRSRLGHEAISMSGVVVLVCSRVVQQSLLVRRRTPECFLASIGLAVMANVSGNVTGLHPLAADRLVSLLDFLGRRRRKAIIVAAHDSDSPVYLQKNEGSEDGLEMVNGGSEPGNDTRQPHDVPVFVMTPQEDLADMLAEFLGTTLEIVASVLQSRSVVSANRHLVYSILHREAILDSEYIVNASLRTQALVQRLCKVIEFFSKHVDVAADASIAAGPNWRFLGSGGGATGISVERVFLVIDQYARHLPRDALAGLPELRFSYKETLSPQDFLLPYAWALAARASPLPWKLDESALPVRMDLFHATE